MQNLNNRQRLQAEGYYEVTQQHGKWGQGPRANGAHYFDEDENPFVDEGMVCGNCIFWEARGGCEIVTGRIDYDGICKLWIIPDHALEV
tara:strand:+ start:422 stop:688 length:267 start_codon:yes stop_codon:yes gene_type:complete